MWCKCGSNDKLPDMITPRSRWVSDLGKLLVPMVYEVGIVDLKDMNMILLKLKRFDLILHP